MPRHLLVLDEVLAMLEVASTPPAFIERFKKQAEYVLSKREGLSRESDDAGTRFEVGSGYNYAMSRGHVRLQVGDIEHQLEPKKAREIGHWLLEATEAAISDQVTVEWLRQKVGLNDPAKVGQLLLDLREIRQGTRGTLYPN